MSTDPFEALETKLAFQEQTISELNDALVAQQEQITALTLAFRALKAEVEGGQTASATIVDERPPHY